MLNTGLDDSRIYYSKVIPASTEKLKAIFLNHFDFRDSLAFLPGSLDACVKDLVKRGKGFPHLRQSEIVLDDDTGQFCNEKYSMLTKSKGVFPYEFLDHTDKLYLKGEVQINQRSFTSCNVFFLFLELPPIEDFYSNLTERNITPEMHEEAKNVFTKLKCQNLGHYGRLYCVLDTLQLLDCVAELRFDLLKKSSLDICHYIGIPAFGLDWMLKVSFSKMSAF